VLTAFVAILAADRGSLGTVALLCLVTAIASGLAKLAVDASIQERIDEQVRASAFAHSETLLMVAWVLGGAVGLIPFGGQWGMIVAAAFITLGAVRALFSAVMLRGERLRGAPADADETTVETPASPGAPPAAGPSFGASPAGGPPPPTATATTATTRVPASDATTVPRRAGAGTAPPETRKMPAQATGEDGERRRFGWRRRKLSDERPVPPGAAPAAKPSGAPAEPTRTMPAVDVEDGTTQLAPPGYTLYRPSGIDPTTKLEGDDR